MKHRICYYSINIFIYLIIIFTITLLPSIGFSQNINVTLILPTQDRNYHADPANVSFLFNVTSVNPLMNATIFLNSSGIFMSNFTIENAVFALGNNRGVYWSRKWGRDFTFKNYYGGTTGNKGMTIDKNKYVYIVDSGAIIYRSIDGGNSFNKINTDYNGADVDSQARDMTASRTGDFIYIAEGGTTTDEIWRSTNGTVWIRGGAIPSGGTDPKAITTNSTGDIFILTGTGNKTIYNSTDKGDSFTSFCYVGTIGDPEDMEADSLGNLYIIHGGGGQDLWKISNNDCGTLEYLGDVNGDKVSNLKSIAIDYNDYIYVVDGQQQIWRSVDGGITFNLTEDDVNDAATYQISHLAAYNFNGFLENTTSIILNYTVNMTKDIYKWNVLAFDNLTIPNSAFAQFNVTFSVGFFQPEITQQQVFSNFPDGTGYWIDASAFDRNGLDNISSCTIFHRNVTSGGPFVPKPATYNPATGSCSATITIADNYTQADFYKTGDLVETYIVFDDVDGLTGNTTKMNHSIEFVIESSTFSGIRDSVMMSLAFVINDRDNDVMSLSNDYVYAKDGELLCSLMSPDPIGTRFNRTYSSNEYILQLKAPLENSRFIITFTKATENDISSRIVDIQRSGLPAHRLGTYLINETEKSSLYLRLKHNDAIFSNLARIPKGSRQILIENLGTTSRGSNISISVVK